MEQKLNARLIHENPKLSYRFGFLGIGMGGTSVAAACADIATDVMNDRFPYSAVLINSNQIDLDKVNPLNTSTKKLLIGNGRGAGRDISVGEALYKSEKNRVEEAINVQFKNVDFVWLVVGLGGGTGTGSVIQAIGSLMNNGFKKKFGLILTLPRLEEGRTVINNALQRLKLIHGAMDNLGPILLIDNQKLFAEYIASNPNASISDYLKYSNTYVADALHDLNVVTASYLPSGENHFDSSEFGIMLRTPGLMHFSRFSTKPQTIDVSQSLSYSTKIKEEVEKGVISDGYDLAMAKRAALSVLTNSFNSKRLYTVEFNRQLEELVSSLAKTASEKPVALYTYETKRKNPKEFNLTSEQQEKGKDNVYFYAVFAGLDLPEKRITQLMEADKSAAEAEKLNEIKVNKNMFEGFEVANTTIAGVKEEKSFDDLFGSKTEVDEKNDEDTTELLKSLNLLN